MVRRHVIGAHYGTRDFLMQRVTAVVMVLYVLLLLGLALTHPGVQYQDWQALFAHNAFKLFTFLFLVSVFLHAWVGMRDILMDYVKPTGVRLTLEVVVIAVLVAYTGWAIQILWGVAK
jgi:succinate dehydrogenase / fumarate reductase membrane anchor subunit